ncbi:group II intron maturase-specific domain-containing protein [Roseivirga spongicola]|uniref:group II intron maturase-specific domain-containing protein n=1 Tax=Roseivirga spongicola TaxID=333140 RepID=UPI001FDF6CF1|nr:group II intron maturase-specific domain-containing protein [Roseivirga spongicola]WPZ09051.1 group II intron maturase-specific domain-containing protein [Roseivirga spongicola]
MSKSSWDNLKRKLKRITKKTLPYSFAERTERLKEVARSWINNFRLGTAYTKLKKLDEWLRNLLCYVYGPEASGGAPWAYGSRPSFSFLLCLFVRALAQTLIDKL